MPDIDIAKLQRYIRQTWSTQPEARVQRYADAFFDKTSFGNKLVAKVVGNHGTYTVSLEVEDKTFVLACSCYIGKGGYCHHCEALARAYLQDPSGFKEVAPIKREEVQDPSGLHAFLQRTTLDSLLMQLKEKGVTQKAFAETINMNPRHLTAIKSSEARNHFFNELGATKLACMWFLEHFEEFQKK